jgi:integrase
MAVTVTLADGMVEKFDHEDDRYAVESDGKLVVHRHDGQLAAMVATSEALELESLDLIDRMRRVVAETAAGKGRDELLWPATSGGYLQPPAPRSWLGSAVKRAEAAEPTFPRVTAHLLRHTAASLAIHAGANPLVVQRMLGHASAAMTLDVYADLFESDLAVVAEKVGNLWARQA